MARKMEARAMVGDRVLSCRVEEVRVKLTEMELLEFGQRMASAEAALRDHALHEKKIKDDLKATKSRLDAELDYLSSCVRQKAEPRDIEIQIEQDSRDRRKVHEVRMDTCEVVRTRPIRSDEVQAELELIPPKAREA
jgi:hypothetical protein